MPVARARPVTARPRASATTTAASSRRTAVACGGTESNQTERRFGASRKRTTESGSARTRSASAIPTDERTRYFHVASSERRSRRPWSLSRAGVLPSGRRSSAKQDRRPRAPRRFRCLQRSTCRRIVERLLRLLALDLHPVGDDLVVGAVLAVGNNMSSPCIDTPYAMPIRPTMLMPSQ